MQPHWVNQCERLPDYGKSVYVLVIQRHANSYDVGYAKATLSTTGWYFTTKPLYPEIVAWLEPSDQRMSEHELAHIPKDRIRF